MNVSLGRVRSKAIHAPVQMSELDAHFADRASGEFIRSHQ